MNRALYAAARAAGLSAGVLVGGCLLAAMTSLSLFYWAGLLIGAALFGIALMLALAGFLVGPAPTSPAKPVRRN